MKTPALVAIAAFSLSACATSQEASLVEQGYARGALAVAAIDRGDWKTAEERLLSRNGAAAGDPARLINLGKVYMETGRRGAALSAWRLALASDSHFMVETMDGRVVSTAVLAREALDRYDTETRSATR